MNDLGDTRSGRPEAVNERCRIWLTLARLRRGIRATPASRPGSCD